MPVPEPPRSNRHGQEIWFKEAVGESGYAPVHRKGWITFTLAFAWIMLSGTLAMVMVVLWALRYVDLLTAFIVPLLVLLPVMLLTGKMVRRHS